MDAVLKTISDQNFYHRFPFLNLLRIPRMALDGRKLLLAILALLLLHFGHQVIDQIFPPSGSKAPLQHLSPFENAGPTPVFTGTGSSLLLQTSWSSFYFPWTSVYEPVVQIAMAGNSWNRLAYLWTHLIWSLVIWSFLGLSVCRLAALEFVTDTRASLKDAARFGCRNGKSVLVAALISSLAGLAIWLILSIFGLIDLWRPFGNADSLVTWIWFIPLLISIPLALLLIGSLAGWPMALATISVEGSDGFDGFSRSFSYIFSKPLRYAVYWLAVIIITVISVWFFEQFVVLVELLAQNNIRGDEPGIVYFNAEGVNLEPPRPALQFWVESLRWLVEGFRVSMFFTAGTVIYYLMRQADDRISLEEVYTSPPADGESDLPLSGIAATSHPQPGHDAPVVPAETTTEKATSEQPKPPEKESQGNEASEKDDKDQLSEG
ncbi:hypothetical protein Pla110_19900 [Polystyrenella longa]|uniref:Uncharacterized protein n=1 Tax=Polystyrenella longa TaxID=2528007 RepID=A0A518CM14_9PLAN|nr:hypothetical protein [Polystyrenella longa]QDU80265.1 hypothetical protein Pla110_19900 [Polystyrenella longa]